MPVTVNPAAHAPRPWVGRKFRHASSPEILLASSLSDDSQSRATTPVKELIQSSFSDLQRGDRVYATKNGFVHACMEAYNEHHCLVIRPEDVWLAILTQLSAYVNARATELRNRFVDHAGQMDLHIEVDLKGIDHGKMAFLMGKMMQDNIKDEGLRDWVQPAYTTTTKVDQAVASIVFMGTMQKYFTYSWGTRCGIPSVKLLGQESDWVKIRQRAERLATFGSESERWLQVLRPVLDGFVSTFREPNSPAVKRFWQGICDEHVPNGSGSTTYSGWITSFCFWDETGRCLHGPKADGQVRLTRSQLPIGFTKVPVVLFEEGIAVPTEMIAGSMAMRASKSADSINVNSQRDTTRAAIDTIQPEIGWFMYKT